MTNTRLPFEATPEYQSVIADMNARIEAELRLMNGDIRSWERRMNERMPALQVRLREERCMNRQTEISFEVKAKLAAMKAEYDEQ